MPCEHVNIGGVPAIVCSSRGRTKRCACGGPGKFLCDWKDKSRRSGTCDRPLCDAHASSPAPEKHLCPDHQIAWAEWKRVHQA